LFADRINSRADGSNAQQHLPRKIRKLYFKAHTEANSAILIVIASMIIELSSQAKIN
jgi:hypothetical protein